ncbi:MAG: helix-turn-helix transcriptional regulator [Rubrivivax sp.]|nr:helix-turn-helix transcriptional regulator [Rubrivivax sp.]
MYDTLDDAPTLGTATSPRYSGPERRSAGMLQTRWLVQMLDEIDYGMLLLGDQQQLLHVNHAARADLDANHPLQLRGRELCGRHAEDQQLLQDALLASQRGLRRLLILGAGEQRVSVATVPLGAAVLGGRNATLLVLNKREVCGQLGVQWFARSHRLTQAETRVLQSLCDGVAPREIAGQFGVGLATVRTQVGSIRAKTGAADIGALVRQVAVLPPMVSSLRMFGVPV